MCDAELPDPIRVARVVQVADVQTRRQCDGAVECRLRIAAVRTRRKYACSCSSVSGSSTFSQPSAPKERGFRIIAATFGLPGDSNDRGLRLLRAPSAVGGSSAEARPPSVVGGGGAAAGRGSTASGAALFLR
eukprot:COSAG04_NODE_3861_length_2465_cov_1.622147_1_plen_131_part_10